METTLIQVCDRMTKMEEVLNHFFMDKMARHKLRRKRTIHDRKKGMAKITN